MMLLCFGRLQSSKQIAIFERKMVRSSHKFLKKKIWIVYIFNKIFFGIKSVDSTKDLEYSKLQKVKIKFNKSKILWTQIVKKGILTSDCTIVDYTNVSTTGLCTTSLPHDASNHVITFDNN
jgi:hypothetical protein